MTEIEAIQAVTREQVEAVTKYAVQCPQCGVRRNQQHRGWCSAPAMIKLPTRQPAGEVRE